jgi:hypothetical protein
VRVLSNHDTFKLDTCCDEDRCKNSSCQSQVTLFMCCIILQQHVWAHKEEAITLTTYLTKTVNINHIPFYTVHVYSMHARSFRLTASCVYDKIMNLMVLDYHILLQYLES